LKGLFNILLINIFLLIPILYLNGQNKELDCERALNEFVIESWNKEDGLPSNSLLNIIQTSDGYIWISSYNGLIRFNGIDFTIFDKSNTSEITSNGIGAMIEDKSGTLWMTTQSDGLLSRDGAKFQSYTFNGLIKELHRVIFIDDDNKIWSCTGDGRLFYMYNDTLKFIDNDVLPKNAIYSSIDQDHNNNIWIGTEGAGLFKIFKDEVENITTKHGLISNWINTIKFDKRGVLWIGTDKGVTTLEEGEFKPIEAVRDHTINKLITNRLNYVWMSSNSGVFRYDKSTQTAELLTKEFGLANNHTIDMFIGAENTLWLTHYKGGLSRIKNTIFNTLTSTGQLGGQIVNTICEVDTAHYLVGYNNGSIIEIKNGKAYCYDMPVNLFGKRIRDIYKDSKGILWIATYSGLLKLFPDNSFTWLTPETGFPAKYVRVIFEDREGQIWVGTRNKGLIKMEGRNSYHTINTENGLTSNLVMSIDEDIEGNLLIATSKGGVNVVKNSQVVNHYTTKEGLVSNIVFNTYIDSDTILWIAAKSGINIIKKEKVYKIETNNSILPYSPFDIIEDANQNFWMPCSDGVMKVSKKTLYEYATKGLIGGDMRLFGKPDGIEEPECTSTAAALNGSDSILWFPTINGICYTNPNYLLENKVIPPVYIEQIDLDANAFLHTKPDVIPSGVNRITFYYSALSYYFSNQNQYKYKLDGYEDDWNPVTYKRSVSYTKLPPGEYTFVVIASNNDGLWNTKGDKYTFTVPHLWYQTVWFKVIVFFVGVLLIYLLYSARMRQLQRRERVLKSLVRKRTAEISEQNRKIEERNFEILQVTEAIKSQNEEIRTINEELEKLSIAARETDNAIRILFGDGKIEWANKSYEDLYGYDSNSSGEFVHNSDAFMMAMNECITQKQTKRIIEQKTQMNGDIIWVQTTLSPIKNNSDKIQKVIALDTDITQLKNAENKIKKQNEELHTYRESLEIIVQERTAELIEAKDKAEESEKLKIAFLTNMSHEIRTPMNAIVGFADLLKMPELSEEAKNEYIQTINENSETLLHLIDDIVEVSRIESGEFLIKNNWHDVKDLALALLEKYKLRIEGRQEIEIICKADLTSELSVYFDYAKLFQALEPIFNNALKYTEKGTIEFGYELMGNSLKFYVKDSGIGIKQKDLNIIFERFRKIEENNLKLYRGAGLGLYISSSIINALGGKVEVESELNVGSIFTITIPVKVHLNS
jgi:PAS domain S-box-containing protein